MAQKQPPQTWKRITIAVLAGVLSTFGVGYIGGLVVSTNPYGYWLFLGLPVFLGLVTSIVLDLPERLPFSDHVMAGAIGWLAACGVLFLMAAEGALCIVMALPIIIIGTLAGSGIARLITASFHRPQGPVAVSVVLVVPIFLFFDSLNGDLPSVRSLSTELIIDATPEQIWPHLSKLDLPAPDFWMFRAGVAHPLEIRTAEQRLGGGRECVLSTGTMHEIITEWEPGSRLAFKMLNTPPTMREWNPMGEVQVEHLLGYYECLEGSFYLIPLSGGRTKLVGKSVFQHRFSPRTYWSWWTDLIVSQVHSSVMEEVKRAAERGD